MTRIEVDESHGVVTLEVDGPLSAQTFRSVSDRVEPEIQRAGGLRGLIIHAETFPGWRDLADFLSNMRFIREGHGRLRRVAAVTDSAPADFMRQLETFFGDAQVQRFALSQTRRAQQWVAAPGVDAPDVGAPAPVAVSTDEGIGALPTDDDAVIMLDESAAGPADGGDAAIMRDDSAAGPDDDAVIVLDESAAESADDIDDWFVKR